MARWMRLVDSGSSCGTALASHEIAKLPFAGSTLLQREAVSAPWIGWGGLIGLEKVFQKILPKRYHGGRSLRKQEASRPRIVLQAYSGKGIMWTRIARWHCLGGVERPKVVTKNHSEF